MATIPTPRVLLDNGSGTFPLDITSKVLSLDGYDVSRGRDDWIGAVTAGELSLTLDNSDGRFTPGSTILGTPSPITVDQRIRVSESVQVSGFGLGAFGVGGFGDSGGLVRFTGYVKSWPVTWPAVVPTFAEVQVTATDAQARAERRTLKSLLEEEILSHSPSAYYMLAEPEGATSAGDSSGNQSLSLTAVGTGSAITFGTGTGPVDGLSAPSFTGGQYLTDGASGRVTTRLVYGLGCTFATTAVQETLVWQSDWYLQIDAIGRIQAGFPTAGLTGPPANDGRTHRAEMFSDGSTDYLLLDGAVVASGSAASVSSTSRAAMYVGGLPDDLGGGGAFDFIGTISHVTTWPALTTAAAASISAAQSGFVGDTANQRIARLATYAGVPSGTLEASTTAVPTQATTGASAWSAIQDVADAEMGLVFIDGTGTLAFHNRNHVPIKTAPDLILDSQYVTPDVQPVTDDQQIINYFEATSVGTGTTSIARNTASEATHGRYPVSQDYLVQTDAEALARANWIVAKQAEPFTRYGTLTINLYKMTATQVTAVLASLDLNCWLRVTSMASQNPGGTVADVVVQGWNASTTGESWSITCNVVARSLFQAALWGNSGSLWGSAVWAV